MTPRRLQMGMAALVLSTALAGCGDTSVEEELVRAEGILRETRGAVLEAHEEVQTREKALETAGVDLNQARRALSEAEAQLAQAESAVDLQATDALLFRGIQRKLLEEERLEQVAIRVEVNKGVVTLHGSVYDPESRTTAIEIARDFPGIASVEDRIDIRTADVGAEGDQAD